MSREFDLVFRATARFPRVSGDEPTDIGTELSIDVFSPRERG